MHNLDAENDLTEAAKQFNLLESSLFKHRTLTLFGEISQKLAQRTAEKLLSLSFESDDPITIYLGSPGGHVESGDTIFDMIGYIKPKVRIVGTGWVGSIATHIYLAPEKEDRLCLPNTPLPDSPAGGRLRRRRFGHRDPRPRDHQDPGAHQPDHRRAHRAALGEGGRGHRPGLLDERRGVGRVRPRRQDHRQCGRYRLTPKLLEPLGHVRPGAGALGSFEAQAFA